MTKFLTIEKSTTAEYKDRGSKFLAYAWPINDKDSFKEHLAAVKKEQPKASHHCFAYRIGTDGNNYRVSDDGEPSGTAGRPILGQIDSKELTNVLIIVVRYFGGTLVGVPGLIQACKSAAAAALEQATIIEKPVLLHYRLQFDYTQMNEVMKLVKQYDVHIQKQEMALYCTMQLGIPKINAETVKFRLEELNGVELLQLAD